jgi:CTP:molybdopterin cytidylyltransferase MocA
MTGIPLILLAGGKSSRMGTPKGLLTIKGMTWMRRQCGLFRAIGSGEIVIVLGYNAEDYLNELSINPLNIQTVINSKPENGPFSSLQEGLRFCLNNGQTTLGVFVLPIDVPCPEKGVWEGLLESCKSPVNACYPVFGDKGGHPVWISEELILKCLGYPPTDRLDFIVRSMPSERIRRVAVTDPQILLNVNDPPTWESYKKTLECS